MSTPPSVIQKTVPAPSGPVAAPEAPVRRPKRLGPVAAAVLAIGVAQFTMGVFTLLDQWLNPTEWVPIPGQTPIDQLEGGSKMILMWSNYAVMTGLLVQTLLAWVITWAIAVEVLGKRRRVGRRPFIAAACLFVAGLVCTFPPLYNWLIPG